MEEIKQERKKYWLKLDKDFLKSSKMKVLKSIPNGKDYIIFYLSLMLESVETVGHLRFTSLVPYNDDMLSAITDTNIDIVRSAVKIFCELGLMQIFDDGTIFMPEVPKITGKESESAERVRKFRDKQKQELLQCNIDVTKSNAYIEEEKEEYKNKKEEVDVKEIINCYEKNIGLITPATSELILSYLDTFSKDIIIKAIKLSSIANKKNCKYICGILKSWENKGFKNILDIEQEEKEFKEKNSNKRNNQSYNNYNQRKYDNLDFLYANKF